MHVTVGICTRDRGASIVSTLLSIAASSHQDFDVVVVDQSEADDTERAACAVISGDARFQYIRSRSRGVSVARNIVVSQAQGPLLAFTDDDCEVPDQWLSILIAHFGAHADVGQIFGTVHAGPHDAAQGFIPTYIISIQKRITSPWHKWREGGIGANMAFRMKALQRVGRFDELLGPGGPLFSCEDGDMTYRILHAGYAVLNVIDAPVTHSGFRTYQQGRAMMRGTALGVSAAYMKHLRLGDFAIVPTLLIEWVRCISWGRLLTLRRRSGLGRFLGYVTGMALSFRYRIDPQRRVYMPHSQDELATVHDRDLAEGEIR